MYRQVFLATNLPRTVKRLEGMHSAIFAMRPIFAIMICECGGDVLIMNES
jgi:hypothetical protein